jgi:flagellar FliJ protein
MMASLLSLRERIEDQKKQEFGKAALELENQRQKLKNMIKKKDESIQILRAKIEKHLDPQENVLFNNYIKLLSKRIEEQKKEVKKAEAFSELKRAELIEATKEKKKLEKLREKKFEQYMIDEKRGEQKITDEVVSYRYNK